MDVKNFAEKGYFVPVGKNEYKLASGYDFEITDKQDRIVTIRNESDKLFIFDDKCIYVYSHNGVCIYFYHDIVYIKIQKKIDEATRRNGRPLIL